MNDLQIVKSSNLLSVDDQNSLISLTKELQNTLATTQIFRTRTEMEISVLNDIKHPTAESKYWQALREQGVMLNELTSLSFEYRKNKVRCAMLLEKIDVETDPLKKELLKIRLEEKQYITNNQERIAGDRVREIREWSKIKTREVKKMNTGNVDNVDNHQLISYTKRWVNQMLEMGNNGSPAERQNLMGQLRSGLISSYKNGVLDIVLDGFHEKVKTQIKAEYGFK